MSAEAHEEKWRYADEVSAWLRADGHWDGTDAGTWTRRIFEHMDHECDTRWCRREPMTADQQRLFRRMTLVDYFAAFPSRRSSSPEEPK